MILYNQFPYSGFTPNTLNAFQAPKSSGIGSLLGLTKKSFSWDSFLNNTQRTLNVINQAMPIYNQVRPMFRNMGTIFKVIGELNSTPAIKAATTATTTSTANAVTQAITTPQFFA